MAVEAGTSIAKAILDHSIGPIFRQCGYLWNHKKNITNLQSQVEKLDGVREDTKHSVLVAEKDDKRIKRQVEAWQESANKISAEARKVMEEYEEKAKAKCFIWLCPNLVSRYQLSRRACKKHIEVDKALSVEFEEVGDRKVRRAMSLSSVEDYFSFDSRLSILVNIVNTLQDGTMNSIGVYGLGGMGKTTLVKQVASRVAEEGIFDEIVMALVTQTPDLKEIQGQIAIMLDLKLEESSVAERAGCLYGRLKGKKVLLILDDLWEVIDLKQVGIPFGSDHLGCKILLTSRFQEILSSMDAKSIFHLGALEEQEAWSLFEEKTRDVVKNPDFLSIGKDVAKRCSGVPVLIVTVGASLLSRPNVQAWKDALNQLKMMKNKEIHEIVYSAMEFISYRHLEEPHKRLFLLCGLLGSRVSINNLLKYSLGWGLFDGSVGRVEDARNRLHTLIHDLKDSCLLLDGYDEGCIHIHDVVRGVAISIARKDLNMFSVGDNDSGLKSFPQDGVPERCTALVFHASHKPPCLPESLKCPLLELFILNGFEFSKDFSLANPDTFFEWARKLKVLDLSGMSSRTLPPSITFLGNLHTLRLDSCNMLKEVSILGGLKKLQVLSLANSEIEELPGEIGQLSELRLLDLTCCSKLKVISAGLLECLSQLEELYMRRSFKRWEAKGGLSRSETSNVSLAELKHLSNLRILEIEVLDIKLVSKDLDFESLERYTIIVGKDIGNWEFDRQFNRKGISKKFSMLLDTTSINHMQPNIIKLLKSAESLCLQELKSIKSVVGELDGDGFKDLKYLGIHTDYEIQFIINVELKQQWAFPALESLCLYNLWKLEKICNGRLMQGSLCKLTTVVVQNCDKLESMFSFSMAIGLPCLQELEVSDCSILKGIVAKKSKEDDNVDTDDTVSEMIMFAQLRKLTLERLPELISFKCSAKMLPILKERQIEEISPVEEEPDSSTPFFKEVLFPRLEDLSVKYCGSLTHLFTPSIATRLVRLQQMSISNCMLMKEIVAKEGGETTTNAISFPNLSSLYLRELPNLTTFYSTVEELGSNEIINHNVKQPLFSEKVIFPNLKVLHFDNLDNIESIWHNQPNEEDSFCKLEDVDISRCAKLLKIFPSTMLNKIQNVKKIGLYLCVALEEIFEVRTRLNLDEITHDVTTVSQLRSLNLGNVYVYGCKSMRQVFPIFVAQCLHQLEELHITDCEGVETIVDDDGEENKEVVGKIKEVSTTFIFPKMTELKLEKLPKVECFYPRKHTLEWPLLRQLDVIDCLQISIFDLLSFSENEDHNQFEKFLFNLELLTIRSKDMRMLTRQYGHFPSELFLNLRELTLTEFHGDESVFVKKCSFQEILSYDGGEGSPVVLVLPPQLTTLTLHMLPELKYICKDNSVCFKFLMKLTVEDCGGLINLIQPSAAASFEQLRELEISGCKMIEEIVVGDRDHDSQDEIIFGQLRKLELTHLPKLASFCRGNYTFRFPELSEVTVRGCPNMRTFSLGITITPKLQRVDYGWGKGKCWNGGLNTAVQHLFFETLVSSWDLTIRSKDMKMLMRHYGHFPSELFLNLKCLKIIKLNDDECPDFPSNFFDGLNALLSLEVNDCRFHEIIPSDGEGPPVLLPHLIFLNLINLPELKYICKEDLPLIPILEELETIYVWQCPRLTNIIPGSVSFKFLEDLTVRDCGGLRNLIPSSVAASLEQLRRLEISGCQMMEEIVAADGDQESEEDKIIIFSNLWELELGELPKLTSFCTANYTFQFPSLIRVIVRECPNMRTFSPRIPITPMLKKVNLTGQLQIEDFEEDSNDGLSDSEEESNGDLSNSEEESNGDLSDSEEDLNGDLSDSEEESNGDLSDSEEESNGDLSDSEEESNGDLNSEERWSGDLNTTVRHLFLETEAHQRLIAADPSTSSSNHHSEPEAQIHDNPTVIEESCEESTKQREEDQTSEPAKTENNIEPTEEVNISGDATKPPKGKKKIDPNYQDQASCSYTSTIPFRGESSVSTEQQSEKSEEQTNAESLAPRDVVASSSLLSSASNRPETSPSLVTEVGTSRAASNSQQNDLQISCVTQEFFTLVSEEQVTKRLDTTDPSTSSNNRSEPEAKQIESDQKEVEEISDKSTEPRDKGQTCKSGIDDHENTIEPSDGKKIEEISEDTIEPGNEIEICEDFIIISEKAIEPRDGIEIPDKCNEPNSLSLESNISKKSHPYPQTHASSSFRSTMPFYEDGESSLPTEQQGEKSKGTASSHSDPSSLSPANEPGEETSAGSLSAQDVTVSSSLLSLSGVTEVGTSQAAQNTQQNISHILCATKEFRALLSEFLQILEAQPLNSVSAEQGQLMMDAFRDMSNMKFSAEWFSPYVEEVRECLEQEKEISEIELQIAETEAQLQALKEKKKALQEKRKHFHLL